MKILLAVLGLLTAFAVVPIDTRPLGSVAHPAADHAASLERFAAVAQAERDSTMEDARSTLLDHGTRTPRVVVLVHGFTNSPRQFRELGQLLFARVGSAIRCSSSGSPPVPTWRSGWRSIGRTSRAWS